MSLGFGPAGPRTRKYKLKSTRRVTVETTKSTARPLQVFLVIPRDIKLPVVIDQSEPNTVEPADSPEQILVNPFVREETRVQTMRQRDNMPQPSYLLNASPDKWQAVWKVEVFDLEQAERLMRDLVREFGADPAATDASRVMRLPGLYNHTYEKPHLARAEEISREVYRPEHFLRWRPKNLGRG